MAAPNKPVRSYPDSVTKAVNEHLPKVERFKPEPLKLIVEQVIGEVVPGKGGGTVTEVMMGMIARYVDEGALSGMARSAKFRFESFPDVQYEVVVTEVRNDDDRS